MTGFYGFVQWCFRDGGSSLLTLIVLCIVGQGLIALAHALRGSK